MRPTHSKPAKRKRPRRAGQPARAAQRPVKPAKSAKPVQQAPPLGPGAWFEKLVALQARLRAPGGCPWDLEQTHASLRTYLLEEAYEVLEALESGDDAKFAEELGDLLLQVVFHSQIASEEARFTVADVIREIHDKMVRRHPHVFGEVQARNAGEVLKHWEHLKAEERKAKRAAAGFTGPEEEHGAGSPSLLDGVPKTAPATLEAFQLTRRAARIGFDWDDPVGILDKWREESAELQRALQAKDAAHIEEEVGDMLFVAVNLARFLHVDPEIALKKANRKFSARFRAMEKLAAEQGRPLAGVPRDELERLWEAAKHSERAPAHAPQGGPPKP
ncbi:MAG: nucleoside triphosphate pyrophosphohydrolase [Acidobacteriia bacterium]|nr:nucleoside triphosphate pyrophosphohydrolase [Terriglobia bacterium]